MHSQSSRAEIDQWRFANEYNFGSFRGDVLEMLRRGYDLYVHYSNFGDRILYFRFRDGFAFADLVDQYTDGDQIFWQPDKKGSGGVLMILPQGDAGTFDEIWDPETLASDFVPLWEMINRGDMRPLYLAFLALCAWFDPDAEDDDQVEPPIPAGLKQSHPAPYRQGYRREATTCVPTSRWRFETSSRGAWSRFCAGQSRRVTKQIPQPIGTALGNPESPRRLTYEQTFITDKAGPRCVCCYRASP